MSEYTPTVWRTGDVITAEKLNKIEEGIAGAPVPTGKITITENGEDIDVSEYALADVNVSGGTSDLDEITVTFNNQTDTAVYMYGAIIDELNNEASGTANADTQQTTTLKLITYKNKAYVSFYNPIPKTQMSASGGVTLVDDLLTPTKYVGFEATSDGYVTFAQPQE